MMLKREECSGVLMLAEMREEGAEMVTRNNDKKLQIILITIIYLKLYLSSKRFRILTPSVKMGNL